MSDLATRSGLPDALKVLVNDFPRPMWEGHSNFDGLMRFWLDRHLMFRDLQTRLLEGAEGTLDGTTEAKSFARNAFRLGGFLLNQLHEHHHVEDHHYFPRLEKLDARIAPGFALLDRDHHALDPLIHGLGESINTFLQDPDNRQGLGALHEGLLAFDALLRRHLMDEEELIVPLILKYAPDLG